MSDLEEVTVTRDRLVRDLRRRIAGRPIEGSPPDQTKCVVPSVLLTAVRQRLGDPDRGIHEPPRGVALPASLVGPREVALDESAARVGELAATATARILSPLDGRSAKNSSPLRRSIAMVNPVATVRDRGTGDSMALGQDFGGLVTGSDVSDLSRGEAWHGRVPWVDTPAESLGLPLPCRCTKKVRGLTQTAPRTGARRLAEP